MSTVEQIINKIDEMPIEQKRKFLTEIRKRYFTEDDEFIVGEN